MALGIGIGDDASMVAFAFIQFFPFFGLFFLHQLHLFNLLFSFPF
jgi:hypothetical protein